MLNIEGNSFAEVYKELLQNLVKNPEYTSSPRGEKIHEITNCELKINHPERCLYTNERRSSQFKYIAAELLWYLSGDNTLDFISKFSKFWLKLKNPDTTVNSNYGYLIFKEKWNPISFTQWQWAYQSLFKDKDTRQAIMHFNLPKHQFEKNYDFVCTMYGNFLIRDNKLHFTIHMRSNDVVLGLPTDIPFFCLLQMEMYRLLRKSYPNLELGSYTHFVNSMHLYERNDKLVDEMLQHSFLCKEFYPINVLAPDGTHTTFVERFIDAYNNGYEPSFMNEFQKELWTWLKS